MTLTGHEHFYEHWVERYHDATGTHRMDHIVTGGGGAPLYSYQGEPSTRDLIAAGVDGDNIQLEVIGVDWGRGFAPYRSAKLQLGDGGR